MSTLKMPANPYISLSDIHLRNHFTKDRIRQHLRRAGLLNRNGHILTQAEYQSRITDVEIGRQNRHKYDDAFLDVLLDLGEEQYTLLCREMEKLKIRLQHQFQRIEKQYARRVQPVKIRVMQNGQMNAESESFSSFYDQKSQSTIETPKILRRSQPSQSPERSRLDHIESKLNEFIDKMKILAKINENNAFLLQLPKTIRELQEKQNELLKELESLKKLNQKNSASPGQVHIAENKTIGAVERAVESPVRDTKEIVSKPNPKYMSRDEIEQLIRQTVKNVDVGDQIMRINNRLSQLEKKINQIGSSTADPDIQSVNLNRNKIIAENVMKMDSTKTTPKSDSMATKTFQTKFDSDAYYQAIMPFIESLPIFDVFSENEWIGIS